MGESQNGLYITGRGRTMNYNIDNLEFGDQNIFKYFPKCNNKELEKYYSSVIEKMLNSNFWSEESYKAPRVNWQMGKNAHSLRNDVFSKSGLYIWGAGSIPLYIGKTHQSFKNRFNRYI